MCAVQAQSCTNHPLLLSQTILNVVVVFVFHFVVFVVVVFVVVETARNMHCAGSAALITLCSYRKRPSMGLGLVLPQSSVIGPSNTKIYCQIYFTIKN